MRCTTCGRDNPSGSKFCLACGTPLASPVAGHTSKCHNCGAELAPGIRFCSNCGTPAFATVGSAPTAGAATTSASPIIPIPNQPPALLALFWFGFALVVYFIIYKDIGNVLVFAAVGGAMYLVRGVLGPVLAKALFFLPAKWRQPMLMFLPFAIYYWVLVQDYMTIIVAGIVVAILVPNQEKLDRFLGPLWPLQQRLSLTLRIALSIVLPIAISYFLAESGEYNGRESFLAIISLAINVPIVYLLLRVPPRRAQPVMRPGLGR